MIMFQKKFTFAISMFALCLVGVNYSTLAQAAEAEDPYTLIGNYEEPGIAAVSLVNKLVDAAGMAANVAADAADDAAVAAASAEASAQTAINALDTKVDIEQPNGVNKALTINASGQVTANQIATVNIANQAVTSAKIANNTITSAQIANNTITSAKIADNTITNADINSGAAIEASKISGLATVATSGNYNDLENRPTAATPSTAGLAKIGVIPNGGQTSTTYATIWVQ